MPPQNGKWQQQMGIASEPGLPRDHVLLLGVASVSEKDQKERLWDPITLHPWRKRREQRMGDSGEGSTVQWLFWIAHCPFRANTRPWVQEISATSVYWDGCFVIRRILNPWPEDKEKGDAWAGCKVMYVLSSTKYNWKFCHAENCM